MPRRAAFGDGHPAGALTYKREVHPKATCRVLLKSQAYTCDWGRQYDPTYADQGHEPKPEGKSADGQGVSPLGRTPAVGDRRRLRIAN